MNPQVSEMQDNLPEGCAVDFPDVDELHNFVVTIAPTEGYWASGKFTFTVSVPEEYNIAVSF